VDHRRRDRRTTDLLTDVTHGRGRHALRRRGGARAWPPARALLAIPRGLHRTRVSEMRVPGTRVESPSPLMATTRVHPAFRTPRPDALRRRPRTATTG
jgi:hypothetical protein